MNKKDLKNLSIKEYLRYKGYIFEQGVTYDRCSSPFSDDKNPSFVVYRSNRFVCYSTGLRGDIFDLVQNMYDFSFSQAVMHLQDYRGYTNAKEIEPVVTTPVNRTFDVDKYITDYEEEIEAIDKYAKFRGITEGYLHGVTFAEGEKYGEWERIPSMMFVHRDHELNVTGAKFRFIHPSDDRFTARGSLNWHVLSNLITSHKQPTLYIMESETSANSLWMYLKRLNKPGVVISFGGVSAQKPIVPEAYDHITDRRVIIDFDGDEAKYLKRVERWKGYGKPVRIRLSKDEDINSLWATGKIDLIYNLIK